MNDVPLIVAGSLAVLATAVHGIAGELLVVRKLTPANLPGSRFGGPRGTKAMVHVSWHITTAAFFTIGAALIAAGAVLDGDEARALALLAAAAASAFAVLVVAFGLAYSRSARSLLRHPAGVVLTSAALLAWWGAL